MHGPQSARAFNGEMMFTQFRTRRFFTAIVSLLIASSLFFVLSCTTNQTRTEATNTAETALPTDPEVRSGLLPNGMRYYLRENTQPAGRVWMRLLVKAGSTLETEEERGIAHFIEHMAFNGTERFPESELISWLRSLGMRFGPEVNAYTSFDHTVYKLEVPSENRRVSEKALAVLDDWTHRITFDPAEVDSERLIILEEYRSGLGAMDRIRREILPVLFDGSIYAERLPIGLPERIKAFSSQDLLDFYKRWYRPDTMAIVLTGDFDAELLEADLANHFSAPARLAGADSETPQLPALDLPAPKADSIKVSLHSDPELSWGFIHLYFKRHPAADEKTVAEYRTRLLENLAVQALKSRLAEYSSLGDTPWAAADTYLERYGDSSRFFVLSAVPEQGQTVSTLRLLLTEKEKLLRFGIPSAELDRLKKNWLSALEKAQAEKEKTNSVQYADELTQHFLRDSANPGIEAELALSREILASISPKDLEPAIASLFQPNDITAFIISPLAERFTIPSEEELHKLISSAKDLQIEAPSDTVFNDIFISELPEAGSILERSINKERNQWTLSNGARVLAINTQNKNDELLFMAIAKGGTSLAAQEDIASAVYASSIMANSGLGDFSKTDIRKKLAGKEVSLNFFSSTWIHGIKGKARLADAEILMQLTHLLFAKPRLEDEALQSLKDYLGTATAQRSQNPDAVFSDTITRLISSDNPWFEPPTPETANRISPEGVQRFVKAALNPADYTFVFIGSFAVDELERLLLQYIASLPSNSQSTGWRDIGLIRPDAVEKTIVIGKEEKSQVFSAWYTHEEYSFKKSLLADLANEYIEIVLNDKIREESGAVYSIGSNVWLDIGPKTEIAMNISWACDPQRVTESRQLILTILQDIANGTIDSDTLIKARRALLASQEKARQDNASLLSLYVNLVGIQGENFYTLFEAPAIIDHLTKDELVSLFQSLLSAGETSVILMPETVGQQ